MTNLRDDFTFQSMTLTSDSRLRLILSEMMNPLDSPTNYLQWINALKEILDFE